MTAMLSRTCYPVLMLCVCLRIGASSLANGLQMARDVPEVEKLLLEELMNDVGAGEEEEEAKPEVKRFNPNSFGFSRGRRLEELAKRLNPASFSFNRGKREAFPVGDIVGRYELSADKRAPPSGFTGMRGRRAEALFGRLPEVGEPTPAKRRPPEGYVVVRGKRTPPSGFTGLRGKKASPPSGFRERRERKGAPPSAARPDWSGSPWTKRAPPSGFQILRGKKSPPEGFLGLRGKKSVVDEMLSSLRVRTKGDRHLVNEQSIRQLTDVMADIRNEVAPSEADDDGTAEKADFRRKFSKPPSH